MYYLNKLFNPILWTQTSEAIYNLILSKLDKKTQVLEVGSGTGHISYLLAMKGHKITLNDIRTECVEDSKKIFNKKGLQCALIPGSFYKIDTTYEFVWNSGLIQCLTGRERKKMIREFSRIGKRVLLIYPDLNNPLKVKGSNAKKIPGVDDAVEYNIDDIPELCANIFDKVTFGELSADKIGLPYKMYWILGEKEK